MKERVLARRIAEYLVKAVREAKVHTSWINPNIAYENAMFTLAMHDKFAS